MKTTRFYAIALAVAALDQASKLLVAARLPIGSSLPVLGGLVYCRPVHNPGGAFGLFQSWACLLTIVTLIAVVAILLLSRRGVPFRPLAGVALALQLGGALGNLADRVRLGYVLDFIDLEVWPVFNLADAAITVGLLLLVYHFLFRERRRL